MSRRGMIAVVVLLLWLAGFAALAQRELFQGQDERLARAGRLVEPGAVFYTVERGGRRIGFASFTADTVPHGIDLSELLVTEVPAAGVQRRKELRTTVHVTRALQLVGYTRQIGSDSAAFVITGTVRGDSALAVSVRAGSAPPSVKDVTITTPLLLPMEIPLAVALGSTPKIGRSYRFTTFDPVRAALGQATVRVVAESLFVLSDSAAFDADAGRWVSAHDTTIHAWRLEEPGGGSLDAWIDASGRVVETRRPGGLAMHRAAYELAFENWSAASRRQRQSGRRDAGARTTASPASPGDHPLHPNAPTANRP